MELNEQDFKRLNMTTKMIKIVSKIQIQQRATTETEELIDEDTPKHDPQNRHPRAIDIPVIQIEVDPENPYRGIDLEQVFYINNNVNMVT